jgi:hypothetical protein
VIGSTRLRRHSIARSNRRTRTLRELITELEALSLAITEADPRWNR